MKNRYIIEVDDEVFICNDRFEPYLVESFEDLEKVLKIWTKKNKYTWEKASIHVDYKAQWCTLHLNEGKFDFFLYKLVKP